MSVAVVVDSASDLPNELADALGIRRVPLTISLGGVDYKDGSELSREKFWELVRSSSELPKTAAPSPSQFDTVFSEELDAGASHVICLTMTKDLSATYQSAVTAASAYSNRVSVFDTRTLTLGEGLIAVAVATAAQAGADAEECQRICTSVISRIVTFGTLDTLENLRKGGRIGAASALLGTLMSFKPLIEVRDGGIEAAGRVRTRRTAIASLLEKFDHRGPYERVGLVHAMATDVESVLAELRAATGVDDVVVSVMGATIGTHAGIGALGISVVLQEPK
ncbi:DegV family protein [Ferrimicrobium acidiphilum]|uniref:DegV family protein n=2 Tax=Ferrimicrobium acidiphilum TaxID=121039 RepID=UPI0023F4F9AA|nr:DegV family protein [Ferrimicrobium acidiphilum]